MESSGVCFGTSGARGLVEKMTPAVCYAYCAAFMQTIAQGTKKVVLGHDLRPSSPSIAAACARAIDHTGAEVIYAGALPTPAAAWYASQLATPAIVVTGSHIPFDRNGIKFYRSEGEISKSDEQSIREALVEVPENLIPFNLGNPDTGALDSYIQRYVSFFGKGALSGISVAVYEHSSVARDALRNLLEILGAKVISLGRTDDFVPIDTEAVGTEDISRAKQWAADYQFDAVVSTDGDADRPLIGTETGEWLRGDLVGLLCGQYLGADTMITPISSNTMVEKCGTFKQVIRTRIGSPYVIAGIQASRPTSQIIVGYEANGGVLLGCDIHRNERLLKALPTRDAVLPILSVLMLAKERQCKVSELTKSLPARYTASDRITEFARGRFEKLLEILRTSDQETRNFLAPFSGDILAIDERDGFRATFRNGDIVHLRPSGNAPELRCYTEADSPEQAKTLCCECLDRIGNQRV